MHSQSYVALQGGIFLNYIREYPSSAVWYVSICLLSIFMAYIATKIKNNKNNKNIALKLLIIILTLVSGLRAYSVGIDTIGYVHTTFVPLINGQFKAAYGEIGFKTLCQIIIYSVLSL